MSRVALPVLRDTFAMSADVVAWTAIAFTLPYMILAPVYGRLSDGVGRRRLILAGIAIFSAGSAMALFATNLTWLMSWAGGAGVRHRRDDATGHGLNRHHLFAMENEARRSAPGVRSVH